MARYTSFIELEVLNTVRLLRFFFIYSPRSDILILSDGVLYIFLCIQNKNDSAGRFLAIVLTASMSNNIPRKESNLTRVQCRLACYSVAFHRRPPTLILQFPLVSVFHDFIVINLCDFLFLSCARDFPRESWRVTPPRLATTG